MSWIKKSKVLDQYKMHDIPELWKQLILLGKKYTGGSWYPMTVEELFANVEDNTLDPCPRYPQPRLSSSISRNRQRRRNQNCKYIGVKQVYVLEKFR